MKDIITTQLDKTLNNEYRYNNLDKLCGLGIIVGYLERTHKLNKDSQFIINDLLKNID